MAKIEDLHVTKLRVGDPAIDLSKNVHGATFVIGAESANVINVGIQLTNAQGKAVSIRQGIEAYLSNDANGDTIEAADAALSVAIGTDGVLIEQATDNSFRLISEADGDIDIDITDTRANTMYLVLIMPDGRLVVSGAITFA